MATNYRITLQDDVRDVLERSTITETALTLPSQLDRDLYVRVNKIVAAAGGKWSRKHSAHVFGRDPRAALGLALTAGHITDQRKALQQFFTPTDLARALAADLGPGDRVLEPSAGAGAIALACRMRGADVTCVELDPTLAAALAAQRFDVTCGDFLDQPSAPVFDAVRMNPPFSSAQDVRHVRHAMTFLRPGGTLQAIMAAGIAWREDRAHRELRLLVETTDESCFLPLGPDVFKAEGTGVATVLLTYRRPA